MAVKTRWKNSAFALALCSPIPFHPITRTSLDFDPGCLCLKPRPPGIVGCDDYNFPDAWKLSVPLQSAAGCAACEAFDGMILQWTPAWTTAGCSWTSYVPGVCATYDAEVRGLLAHLKFFESTQSFQLRLYLHGRPEPTWTTTAPVTNAEFQDYVGFGIPITLASYEVAGITLANASGPHSLSNIASNIRCTSPGTATIMGVS